MQDPGLQAARNRIDGIIAAIEQASAPTRDKIDGELRDLHAHADEGFIQTVLETGRAVSPPLDLAVSLSGMSTFHARCMWLSLTHPNLYRSCLRFNDAEGHKFHPRETPVSPTQPGDAEVDALKTELAEVSVSRGLGRGVHCEVHARGESTFYFIRLQNSERLEPNFDNTGQISNIKLRPAYDVIFDYDPTRHVLRTYVKGTPALRRQMEGVFGETMLGAPLPPETKTPRYAIKQFATNLSLPVEPTSPVKAAHITRIRYDYFDNAIASITVDFRDTATALQAEEAIGFLSASRPSHVDVEIGKVWIQAEFKASRGARASSRTFYVTEEECNLSVSTRDQILKALLKEWKIDVHQPPNGDAPKAKRNIQRNLQLGSAGPLPAIGGGLPDIAPGSDAN